MNKFIDLAHKLMPREGLGDAAYLALGSLHRCRVLVAWNRRPPANANKIDHLRR